MRLPTLTILAALLLGAAACDKTIDIDEQAPIALPTFSNKPLLRREEVTIRAFFISKDRAFVELPSNCVLSGPHGRTKLQSPKKVQIPVYAGKVPEYNVTCGAVVGASERSGKSTLRIMQPDTLATPDNAPTYNPRWGVPVLLQ